MKIELTQEDIDKGIRFKCSECPVALALLRLFPGYHVYVGGINGNIEKNYKLKATIKFDFKTQELIRNFDQGRIIEPQTLEVEVAYYEN